MSVKTMLDNGVVRKYFCNCAMCNERGFYANECSKETAYAILDAMQQPIRKGELVLERFPSSEKEWQLMKSPRDFEADLHAGWLRLPDKFQTKECCGCHHGHEGYCRCKPAPEPCGCMGWHKACEGGKSLPCPCSCHKPSSAVEEKIQELAKKLSEPKMTHQGWVSFADDNIVLELRALVKMARDGK